MKLGTLIMLAIIITQFVALAVAMRVRVNRVEKKYPRRSPTPQNGKSHATHFTPSMGVQRVD